jgi:hypothetical protein
VDGRGVHVIVGDFARHWVPPGPMDEARSVRGRVGV